MAVNEIGLGGYQNVLPGTSVQGGRLVSRSDSSNNLGGSDKEEIYKVELSPEALEMAKLAKERVNKIKEEIQLNSAIQEEARQQKSAELLEAAKTMQREKIDITV
jgi:hypothetical protein